MTRHGDRKREDSDVPDTVNGGVRESEDPIGGCEKCDGETCFVGRAF